jgi:hypothetical protein
MRSATPLTDIYREVLCEYTGELQRLAASPGEWAPYHDKLLNIMIKARIPEAEEITRIRRETVAKSGEFIKGR